MQEGLPVHKQDLQKIEAFQDLPEDHLEWLIENGEIQIADKGEYLFYVKQEVNTLVALVEGEIQILIDTDGSGELRPTYLVEPGMITGYLPYSRMKYAGGSGLVNQPSRIYRLHKDTFTDMSVRFPEIVKRLVALMTDRARRGVRFEQEQEKLVALGKLAAGLAHEINNPASAIQRTASAMDQGIEELMDLGQALSLQKPDASAFQAMNELIASVAAKPKSSALSSLALQMQADEIIDWLEDQGVEEPEELSELILDHGLGIEELESIEGKFNPAQLGELLGWKLKGNYLRSLAAEVQSAAGRISELLDAIKTYSHMDRATALQPVDLKGGLESTLKVMQHKIAEKQISYTVEIAEPLPLVMGQPSELNQIWTHLISNAVDAMEQGGNLLIASKLIEGFVQISIIDDGHGIPQELHSKIFEPFFTTKPQGQGTGLGLDIVRRIIKNHNGDIKFSSKPQHTEFVACFPILETA